MTAKRVFLLLLLAYLLVACHSTSPSVDWTAATARQDLVKQADLISQEVYPASAGAVSVFCDGEIGAGDMLYCMIHPQGFDDSSQWIVVTSSTHDAGKTLDWAIQDCPGGSCRYPDTMNPS